MNKPQKAYSAYQLISVATVANTLARCRSIAGLEALQQLAEAVERGSLCADLYPQHDPCFYGGNSDLIGKPTSNSPGIWRKLATKTAERYKGGVVDFSYPPAASTWHLLADDVFAFANSSALTVRAAAAMRELAIRYKAELGDLQGDATELHDKRQSLNGQSELANVGTVTEIQGQAAAVVAVGDGAAKRRARKPSIETVALDYMRKVYQAGHFQSAAKFHKHLCKNTEEEASPFEMGTGANGRRLFCPGAASFFEEGTLGKMWRKIRAA